jgi:hypothetical protein
MHPSYASQFDEVVRINQMNIISFFELFIFG